MNLLVTNIRQFETDINTSKNIWKLYSRSIKLLSGFWRFWCFEKALNQSTRVTLTVVNKILNGYWNDILDFVLTHKANYKTRRERWWKQMLFRSEFYADLFGLSKATTKSISSVPPVMSKHILVSYQLCITTQRTQVKNVDSSLFYCKFCINHWHKWNTHVFGGCALG
jgi:hypothetical protein